MIERPDAKELVEAVAEYIVDEVVPSQPDARSRFRSLVAANVLAIVTRELDREGLSELRAEARRLADAIRRGDVETRPGDETWKKVRRSLVESLRIANPRFLEQTGYHESEEP